MRYALCAIVLTVSFFLGAGITDAAELLPNGDFNQDWSVGWTRNRVPETLSFAHVTVESGQLRLHAKGQGEVYLYQRHPYSGDMSFSFRAWMESRENLFGIGVPGAPYVGLALLNGQGEKIGGLYWASFTGFAVTYLFNSIRFPDPELRFNFIPMPSQKWVEYQVSLRQQIQDFLPAVDPQEVKAVVVVLGVMGPTSRSEGILQVDWTRLEARRPRLRAPRSLDFGAVEVGTEQTEEVEIHNDGDADLVIEDILDLAALRTRVFGDPPDPAGDFWRRTEAPLTIPPGQTQRLEIVFAPLKEGTYEESATLYTNDPDTPQHTLTLTGQGVVYPHIQVEGGLDLGSVEVGDTLSLSVPVRSTGQDVLQVQDVQAPAGFQVAPTRAEIAPGDTAFFTLLFTPQERRVYAGEVRIPSNDPDQPVLSLRVRGEGVAPELRLPVLKQETLDLGRVRPEQLITYSLPLDNAGSSPLEVALAIDAPFGVQPKALQIQPGEEATVMISFRVAQHGAFRAILTVQSNDPVQPLLKVPVVIHANAAPTVSLGDLPGRLAGPVGVPYLLADPENDRLTLAAEWAADPDVPWRPLPGQGVLTDIAPAAYRGVLPWDTWKTPGYGLHRLRVRLRVADGAPGGSVEQDLTIENVAGDFTFDRVVDAKDIPGFREAYWQQDRSREIGPATGQQPYLIPQPDGRLDIEDLQVLVSQLHWFSGNRPAARPVASVPPRLRVRWQREGETVQAVLVLEEGAIEAGALQVVLTGQPQGLEVLPGAGLEPDLLFVHPDGSGTIVEAGIRRLPAGSEGLSLRWKQGTANSLAYRLIGGNGTELQGAVSLEPAAALVLANHPNPFNRATELTYRLPWTATVDLIIYDLLGRRVQTLISGQVQAPGFYRMRWNGRDDQGRPVASGMYLAQLAGQGPRLRPFRQTVHLLLVK